MKIYQSAELSADPQLPMEAATKQYVDNQIVSGAIVGGVFFTDVTPTSTGIVGNKAYVANTVPANKVITDATADTQNVRVSLLAEGGSAFYSPTITITTNPVLAGTPLTVALTEDTYDKRLFSGFADLVGVTANTVVTATSSTNASASMTVHVAAAGPAVSSVTIGAYPGSQTEAKQNDVMTVTGVVANSANYVELIVAGAVKTLAVVGTIGANDSSSAGFKTFSGSFTVSNLSGAQSVTARAKNALGTFGANVVSSNTITLNQTFPTIGTRTITYPSTQSAIKGGEIATVAATVTNYDTVAYTSSANLTVGAPNVYAASKSVTRVSGTYVNGTANYTITATKTSNAAVTTATAAIVIADAAPTAAITITGSPSRLISSQAGQSYVVNLTPSQVLNAAPTLVASSGTWQGSWVLTTGVWSRTLLIADTDVKGAQTFNTMVLTNLANVTGNTITSGSAYTVGGFVTRTITFAAFSQLAPIGTSVGTIANTSAKYTGTANNLTLQNSTANVPQGYTITDASGNYNATGSYLFITDAAYAGANTSGTLQVDIGEVA